MLGHEVSHLQGLLRLRSLCGQVLRRFYRMESGGNGTANCCDLRTSTTFEIVQKGKKKHLTQTIGRTEADRQRVDETR